VSITGVNGWYSANQRIAVGIDCVSTKPLPRKARMMSGVGALLADSTDLAARPRATESQVRAKANRIRIASIASGHTNNVFAEAALDGAQILGPDTPAGAWLADTGRFLKNFGEDLLRRAEYWHAVITGRGQSEA
jgi:hypothetical protein